MRSPKNIRNIALLGSSGGGKTTLAEHMIFNAKATTRIGKVEDGNTVMDWDADEIEKRMSISMSLGHFDYKNERINVIDTPGYPEYMGEQLCAVTAVETAIIVASAVGMYDTGLEQAIEAVQTRKIAKAILVNKMDSEHADYDKVIESITDNSDLHPAPLFIPIGREGSFQGVIDLVKGQAYINDQPAEIPADMKDAVEEYRAKLMEGVAESDDALLETFLENGELSHEQLVQGVKNGIKHGSLIPVFACSANHNLGVVTFMDAILEYLPSPADVQTMPVLDGENAIDFIPAGESPLFAYVFKSFSDPNVGDMAYIRVFSGSMQSGLDVYVPEKDGRDKIGGMYFIQGKNRKDTGELCAGDIGGLVKLKTAKGLTTITSVGSNLRCLPVKLPEPMFWQAIKAQNQSDEDKIGAALTRILEEDPTVSSAFDPETHEHIISAIGEQQINLVQKRLKSRFKVEAVLSDPRIPYRETITGKSDVSYRHKKQTGGRGQYGEVYFRVCPTPRGDGFVFTDSIVGGTIPSKFIPAIEKGVNEIMAKGIIAGCKVVDIQVEVYFGSYHDVDSSEMAFKIASSMALRDGFQKASPILLEPIQDLQIVIPSEFMGDVMGDISTRRGKILGMEQRGKKQILNANLPLAELAAYFPALKSITQGRGKFTQRFAFFEKVPAEIAEKVIAAYREQKEQD
jgi:elongation factor G